MSTSADPMRHLAALALGLMLGVLPAHAADSAVELTPFLGLRDGATLAEPGAEGQAQADATGSFGLVIDFPLRPDARVEIFVERQRLTFEENAATSGVGQFDLTVDDLQAGSVYEPPRKRLRPFVGVALGLRRFDADGARVDHSVDLSASAGGGVKVPLGRRLALRLEARGYTTFSDTTVVVACGPGCSVELVSDGWLQLAGRIGLTIRL